VVHPDHVLLDDRALVQVRGYVVGGGAGQFDAAIAAPVRNAEGTVIASVSASGPSFRIPATRIPALAAAVRQAADEVSGRLGWIAR
jgi:DNA-binding IclR family transcriptional regulator